MEPRPLIRIELTRRQAASGLAVALLFAAAAAINSETYRVVTSYPAPTGVYNTLSVKDQAKLKRSEYHGYEAGGAGSCVYAGIAGPCLAQGETVPRPGQIFYNRTRDRFYYTSKDAVSNDQETWFRPMSGFDETMVISASVSSYQPPDNKNRYIAPWSASMGTVVTNYVRSATQKVAGLYVFEVSGQLCQPGGFLAGDTQIAPTITLYKRNKGQSGFPSIGSTSEGAEIDATDCGNFSIESMFMLAQNKQIEVRVGMKREKNKVQRIQNVSMTVTRVLGM